MFENIGFCGVKRTLGMLILSTLVFRTPVARGQSWGLRYGAAYEQSVLANRQGIDLSNRAAIVAGNQQLLQVSRESAQNASFFMRNFGIHLTPWFELMAGHPDAAQGSVNKIALALAIAPLGVGAATLFPTTAMLAGGAFSVYEIENLRGSLNQRLKDIDKLLYEAQSPQLALLKSDQIFNDAIFGGVSTLSEAGTILGAGAQFKRAYGMEPLELSFKRRPPRELAPLVTIRAYISNSLNQEFASPARLVTALHWLKSRPIQIDENGDAFVTLAYNHIIRRVQPRKHKLIPFFKNESKYYGENKILNFSDGEYLGSYPSAFEDDLEVTEIQVGKYLDWLQSKFPKETVHLVTDPVLVSNLEGNSLSVVLSPKGMGPGVSILKFNTFVLESDVVRAAQRLKEAGSFVPVSRLRRSARYLSLPPGYRPNY